MNGGLRCAFSFSTHTEACVTSQWGHKHTNNISRTALRVTSWAFHHFIGVKLSSYHTHRNVKVFTATRQNKSPGFLKTVQQKYLFSRMYITLLLKLYYLRNDHTTFLTCFKMNSKFPLFAKCFCNFKQIQANLSNFIYHFISYYLT